MSNEQTIPLEITEAEVQKRVEASVESGTTSVATGHVHGPGCGHDHSHSEAPKEPPKGKYRSPAMIPTMDLKATFENNNEGPIWRKTPQELLTNIAFQAANVPEGGVKVCFVNNEAYKFLLSLPQFCRKFTPANPEQQKQGIVGLFETHVVIVCDALWEAGEQLTLHKAIYFCDEVLVPVNEVVIETAGWDGEGSPEDAIRPDPSLCEDEGCDHHGTEHVCVDPTANLPHTAETATAVNFEDIADDVLDKENGRCINCLDTGCVAGDPDQTCGCPAGQGGNPSFATED